MFYIFLIESYTPTHMHIPYAKVSLAPDDIEDGRLLYKTSDGREAYCFKQAFNNQIEYCYNFNTPLSFDKLSYKDTENSITYNWSYSNNTWSLCNKKAVKKEEDHSKVEDAQNNCYIKRTEWLACLTSAGRVQVYHDIVPTDIDIVYADDDREKVVLFSKLYSKQYGLEERPITGDVLKDGDKESFIFVGNYWIYADQGYVTQSLTAHELVHKMKDVEAVEDICHVLELKGFSDTDKIKLISKIIEDYKK